MASTQCSGGQSPKSFSRTLEKSFEEARQTGHILLSSRKLRDFPKCARKYDLSDTTGADLSNNQLSEIPAEVCELLNMEHLNCYSNVLRCIPQAIVQLQNLVHLNLSRNQLLYIPEFIGQLQHLQVLLASNNRLVSMPEELGQLKKLMDLDVSCNEITHLPRELGNLESLRSLNVRRNLLVELPTEICRLKLQRLDVSDNRISTIPNEYRQMDTLDDIQLLNNPLTSPPAQVCRKGRVHIIKYLEKEALKEDRKRGVLSELQIPNVRSTFPKSFQDDLQSLDSTLTDRRMKRRTVDSGYSTTDGSEMSHGSRFSPSEVYNQYNHSTPDSYTSQNGTLTRAIRRLQTNFSTQHAFYNPNDSNPATTTPHQQHPVDRENLVIQAADHAREQRQRTPPATTRGQNTPSSPLPGMHRPPSGPSTPQSPHPGGGPYVSAKPSSPLIGGGGNFASPLKPGSQHIGGGGHYVSPTPSSPLAGGPYVSSPNAGNITSPDEFTKELEKQRSDYESRKKKAESMKQQMMDRNGDESMPYDSVREETRRAAIKLQEEQKALRDRQKELATNRQQQPNTSTTGVTQGNGVSPTTHSHMEYQQPPVRKVSSFKEDRQVANNNGRLYRRTVSETKYSVGEGQAPGYLTADSQVPDYSGGDGQSPGYTRNDGQSPGYTSSDMQAPDYSLEERQDPGYYEDEPMTPTTPTPDGVEYREITHTDVHTIPVEHYSSSQNTATQKAEYSQTPQGRPEFRRRREVLVTQQRHEAQMVRRRLEEEKLKLKQRQKDAVRNYITQRGGHNDSSSDSSTFSFSRDSTPNTSFDANAPIANAEITTPPNYQKALDKLEAMSSELNNTNPGFTVRRQLDKYSREGEQAEYLRQVIESRLKVKLPEHLPSALRDGVVLCHLANHIRPRSISSIHVPSQSVPKLSAAKCRRNVENFLEACRKIGVKEEYLCPAQAIVEQNGTAYLCVTVQSLLNCASKISPQQSTV